MIVGITGNSGAGKSEVAKILSQKIDVEIIDADKVVRNLSKPGNKYYEKILELFGNEILTGNALNRQKIAEIIYNDNTKRKELNNLTYKYVVDEIKAKVEEKIKDNKNVVIDAPLLFESGLNKLCNFTIAVLSDKQIKLDRICRRDKLDRKMAESRLNIQPKDEFYKERADYIIENNSKIEEIDVEDICTKIGRN